MPISHTPRRIACLEPSATVVLDALGELGRVVACTRYCADVVPEVDDGSRVIWPTPGPPIRHRSWPRSPIW